MKSGSSGIAVSSGPRSGLNPFHVRTRYRCGRLHASLMRSWSDEAAGAGALSTSGARRARTTTRSAPTRRTRDMAL